MPAIAKDFTNRDFLEFSEGQKDVFFSGAYLSIGHLISSMHDKKKGQCFADWYFDKPKERMKEIESVMRKNPDLSPTTILIGLPQLECGKLKKG